MSDTFFLLKWYFVIVGVEEDSDVEDEEEGDEEDEEGGEEESSETS